MLYKFFPCIQNNSGYNFLMQSKKMAGPFPTKTEGAKGDRLDRVQREVRQRLEKWLENTPYQFNPDTPTVDTIIKGLALRRLKYGEEYCPCRVVGEDKEKNKGIICPCIYHNEEIAQNGVCFCGLFVGQNYEPE